MQSGPRSEFKNYISIPPLLLSLFGSNWHLEKHAILVAKSVVKERVLKSRHHSDWAILI